MTRNTNAAEAMIRESVARQPLLKLYGVEVRTVSHGYIELALPVKEFMLRTSGFIHGGVLTALADSAGGYALAAAEEKAALLLSVELKINFLNKAKGDIVLAAGKVLKNGRTIAVTQADLYTIRGTEKPQVATALITFTKKEHGNKNS